MSYSPFMSFEEIGKNAIPANNLGKVSFVPLEILHLSTVLYPLKANVVMFSPILALPEE